MGVGLYGAGVGEVGVCATAVRLNFAELRRRERRAFMIDKRYLPLKLVCGEEG